MNAYRKKLTLRMIIAFSMLLLLLRCVPTFGQVSKGSVSGAVADPQGAVIADAAIRLVNQQTNEEFTTNSGNDGLFRLNLLPVGVYRLEITKEGFRKEVSEGVEVTAGADHGLGQLKLALGEATISVEVTTNTSLLESTEAQVSNVLGTQAIQSDPSITTNEGLDNLALLVPGVAPTRDLTVANTNGPGFSVNGIRGHHNDQEIDGQSNNSNVLGGPQIPIGDGEFVQEYQITTSNFGAEYGRNSGSVVNIITKSGANQYHGSAYTIDTNSAFSSLGNIEKAEGLTSPEYFNDQFSGATIGGPLVKDRLFFFGGFDEEMISQTTISTTGPAQQGVAPWTPTPNGLATLAACFPGSPSIQALQTFGPYGIKGGTFSQVGSPDLEMINGCPNPVEFSGIQRIYPSPIHTYNWITRLDLQTTKNHFYGRYLYSRNHQFDIDEGNGVSGYPIDNFFLGQDYGFSWVRVISPLMTNEFRANYGRANNNMGGNTFGSFPLANQIENSLANVNFSLDTVERFVGFGTPAPGITPSSFIENTYEFQDNWNYIKGRHALKAGANFDYLKAPFTDLPDIDGRFSFGSFDRFAADMPGRIKIANGDPHDYFTEKETYLYFGDDIRATKDLTLNLGLTWSYYGQPANLFHDLTAKRESDPSTAFWLSSLPTDVRVSPRYPSQKNNWGPGIGFAYSPTGGPGILGDGKTVFRGGYRLMYDPSFWNLFLNMAISAPVSLLDTIGRPVSFSFPMPADIHGDNVRSELASVVGLGTLDPRTFSQTQLAPNIGPQRIQEWSFGVQREIAPNTVLEARYIGNHATHLFQAVNGNPRIDGLQASFPGLVPAGTTPCPASQAFDPVADGRVNCNAGIIREFTNNGYSDYNGLQLELRAAQLWHQLMIRTGYTWSKDTDNSSSPYSTLAGGATSAFSQNPFDFTKGEHGLSGLDFPNNWTLSFMEEIPGYKSQQGVLGHLLGGWSFSGEYHIISGQTYTPSQASLNCLSQELSPTGTGCLSSNSFYDLDFFSAFESVTPDGAMRPYISNPRAPANTVGMYAGDACNIFGGAVGVPIGCDLPATQLVSLNAANNLVETSVSNSQVRYIANTVMANTVFGTPFGNAGRNSLRDARTNTANFALFKTFNINERVSATLRMIVINPFNHRNYSSVDAFIDDAGLALIGTGFANPSLTGGGVRAFRFGAIVRF
jgi:hypothetical protein